MSSASKGCDATVSGCSGCHECVRQQRHQWKNRVSAEVKNPELPGQQAMWSLPGWSLCLGKPQSGQPVYFLVNPGPSRGVLCAWGSLSQASQSMYFPLPAESAPKGMGAPLLKIFAEAKYFNPELFSVTVGKRLYYLIQLYTSYSEFAKIHTDVKDWI